MVTWEQLAMFWQGMFVLALLYSIRETILSRIYGVRFKRWIEIDTGRFGYTILDKSLDKCKILNQMKTVSRKNILNNFMYFVNDNCENLKLEPNNDKWLAYCNSEEFDTVFKNQMLQQLMLIMERSIIKIILIMSIITFVALIYVAYGQMQMKDQVTYLVQEVANYAAGTTTE